MSGGLNAHLNIYIYESVSVLQITVIAVKNWMSLYQEGVFYLLFAYSEGIEESSKVILLLSKALIMKQMRVNEGARDW